MANPGTHGTDTIEVTGHGQAVGTPDLVVLDLRLQAEADTVAASLAAVAEATRSVLERTAEHRTNDVPGPRTRGLNLHTRTDREGRQVLGYTASQQLRLTVAGTDLAGEVVTAVSGAAGDALRIDGLSLTVADPADLQVRARDAAFDDARERAEQYAELAGRSLGAVRTVVDAPSGHVPMPKLARAAAFSDAAMPIEGGEHSVSASVTVTWDLA
ncbi:SIMPL domain-containing protein [Ornithinimicrobium sp. F0845]|uniref:SIMPL domain-containing protein n=1 Tax=Ornithinimicrobium sp. F0845 TaxID=2926412 RepID=UPI001FF182F6|nr:SIMPL domain-containing protein [Ornithinimicrobium sp. F0845]MCK0111571.1 SIMPL domain-containing protein [Ornithinimicrobium sp. F0845]